MLLSHTPNITGIIKNVAKLILPTAEVTHADKQTKALIHFQAMALLTNSAKSAE